MAAEGTDLAGEARFVDALLARGSRVLDAGCGPGRISGELHARGHEVVGVDVDPALIEAAREDYPGPRYVVADLETFELDGAPFDAALLAGNVLIFVTPDSEQRVLTRVAEHIRPAASWLPDSGPTAVIHSKPSTATVRRPAWCSNTGLRHGTSVRGCRTRRGR